MINSFIYREPALDLYLVAGFRPFGCSMKYSELLKNSHWQKKRLLILQRDNFTCQSCCSTTKTLHVHHCYYSFGKMPWEYEDTSLLTLCFECHEDESFSYHNRYSHPLLLELAKLGFLASDLEMLSIAFSQNTFVHDRDHLNLVLFKIFKNKEFFDECLQRAVKL